MITITGKTSIGVSYCALINKFCSHHVSTAIDDCPSALVLDVADKAHHSVYVPDPEVSLGALKDHFEIATCEPGRETRSGDNAKAFEWTANWRVDQLVWTSDHSGLDLDYSYSESKETMW